MQARRRLVRIAPGGVERIAPVSGAIRSTLHVYQQEVQTTVDTCFQWVFIFFEKNPRSGTRLAKRFCRQVDITLHTAFEIPS